LKLSSIIILLLLVSCKTTDINPTTTILKHVITNGNK